MKFSELSKYLEKLEKTSSRIEITLILANLFKKANKEEIDKITYLLLGQLAPSYRGIVFNLAERMMLEVIAKAYGLEKEKVVEIYRKEGDLGNTASLLAFRKKIKDRNLNLSVTRVYERLVEIAKDEGEKSQERKIEKMAVLFSELDPLSVRFLARIPVGKLRLGFSDKTILDALSWMETGNKSKKDKLEKAYRVVPDVGLLGKRVKEMGIDKASIVVKPEVGIPVLPMLAQRLKSPKEMIAKMGKVAVEPKFDGLRVLIHLKRTGKNLPPQVWAFTRNLNNVYDMFPELKDIGKFINADSVILDSEAIGMDPETMILANFQTTMRRRRKYEIEAKAKEIPLRFQVFDIIFKDGKSLMDNAYLKRREILESTIRPGKLLVVDEMIVTDSPEVINEEYKKKIKEGLEGIVVKKADAEYIPGRTGWRWVKMKQEEESSGKLSDTVDCIVMGYYAGRGKRAVFGLGGFLVGILDGEDIKTVTKIGTGLSDEQFREMFTRLKRLKAKEKPKEYKDVAKTLTPQVWVTPSLVVEIAADEITKSPIHSAGYALRFPRLVKFRDDKSYKEATTSKELIKLFQLQKS
jgi:DNA ligase-1